MLETPEEFELLKTGQLAPFNIFEIPATAEPDLLTDPILLVNAGVIEAKMKDFVGNVVDFSTLDSSLFASISGGRNIIAGIPPNLKKYQVHVRHQLAITDKDIDHILTWSRAASIDFSADNEIIFRLANETSRLSQLAQLWQLAFWIDQSSVSSLKLNNFFVHLPALSRILIHIEGLAEDQITKFIRDQGKLHEWTVIRDPSNRSLTFQRNYTKAKPMWG